METKELKCTSCGAPIKPAGMEQYYECPNCGAILNIKNSQQSEKCEERKKSGKITSLIAAIGMAAGLTITGALLVENSDHLHYYCPFNYILGIQHQVNKINKEHAKEGFRAYTSENGKVTIHSDTKTVIDSEGRKNHYAPSGFCLNGREAYKTLDAVGPEDSIYITQGKVIWPVDDQPRDYLGVWDPEIIRVIK